MNDRDLDVRRGVVRIRDRRVRMKLPACAMLRVEPFILEAAWYGIDLKIRQAGERGEDAWRVVLSTLLLQRRGSTPVPDATGDDFCNGAWKNTKSSK